jgi:mRNA interferase RelE/StbE
MPVMARERRGGDRSRASKYGGTVRAASPRASAARSALAAEADRGFPARWERRAVKELEALPKDAQQRIVEAVESLRGEPFKGEQLAAEWKGLRRLRIGRYRVIYAFDGQQFLILVVRVGHRKDVCRHG